MTEESNLKISIVACVFLLLSMVICVQPAEISDVELSDVSIILDEHNFSEWSTEDQSKLTELMRLTADPNTTNDSFIAMLFTCPRHVLETYGDLMENS